MSKIMFLADKDNPEGEVFKIISPIDISIIKKYSDDLTIIKKFSESLRVSKQYLTNQICLKIPAIKYLVGETLTKQDIENLPFPELRYKYLGNTYFRKKMLFNYINNQERVTERNIPTIIRLSDSLAGKELHKVYVTFKDLKKEGIIRVDNNSYNTGTSYRTVPPAKTIEIFYKRDLFSLLKILKISTEFKGFSYGTTVKREINMKWKDYYIKGNWRHNGKGMTKEAAEASVLMECVERFSAEPHNEDNWEDCFEEDLDFKVGTCKELERKGVTCLSLDWMEGDYLSKDIKLTWVKGKNSNQEEIYVPANLVFGMDHPRFMRQFPNLFEGVYSVMDSNGLASGNTYMEAKLHALCELLEREAYGSFLIDSIDSLFKEHIPKYLQTVRFKLKNYDGFKIPLNMRSDFIIYKIPSYFGFPTFYAVSGNTGGGGGHLNGRMALTRALCEMQEDAAIEPINRELFNSSSSLDIEELPNYSTGNITRDVKLIETLLSRNKLEVIYINLTRKNIGFPVVRCIVPSMNFSESKIQKQPRFFRRISELARKGEL